MKTIHKLTSDAEVETELLALCKRKCACDDALGRCSDHEGTEEGPTYAQFRTMPHDKYAETLDYYIGQHERAIRVLRRLIQLRRMSVLIEARQHKQRRPSRSISPSS